jgi:hypothetical protein
MPETTEREHDPIRQSQCFKRTLKQVECVRDPRVTPTVPFPENYASQNKRPSNNWSHASRMPKRRKCRKGKRRRDFLPSRVWRSSQVRSGRSKPRPQISTGRQVPKTPSPPPPGITQTAGPAGPATPEEDTRAQPPPERQQRAGWPRPRPHGSGSHGSGTG